MQRHEGRRRLRLLTAGAVVTAVVVAVVGLALSPAFDVDHVLVVGAVRAEEEAVERAAGIERGDPLVALDAGGVAAGVRSLPWVETVVVERVWPGTVAITVVEREPVAALVRADGRASLVDGEGRVLAEVAPEATEVLQVVGLPEPGPPGSVLDRSGRQALAVASGLPATLLAQADALRVGTDGTLELDLVLVEGEEPTVVLLDDGDDLGAKLTALATVVASVALEDLATIDLAVPSAPALTRR